MYEETHDIYEEEREKGGTKVKGRKGQGRWLQERGSS